MERYNSPNIQFRKRVEPVINKLETFHGPGLTKLQGNGKISAGWEYLPRFLSFQSSLDQYSSVFHLDIHCLYDDFLMPRYEPS